ncbi:MAG: hypothetical protein ACJ71S_12810 [Acidobacteriaceae bacterium]
MVPKVGTIGKAIGADQSMAAATLMVTTKGGRTMTTVIMAMGMEKAGTAMAATVMTNDD